MEDKHASNAYIGIIILNLDVKNVLIEPGSKVLNWTSSNNFIIFIASNTLVKKKTNTWATNNTNSAKH